MAVQCKLGDMDLPAVVFAQRYSPHLGKSNYRNLLTMETI